MNIKKDKEYLVRTDLILEQKPKIKIHEKKENNISIIDSKINRYKYTTIYFDDIEEKEKFKNLEEVFIKEINKYLKLTKKDTILVIGLGNIKSTPDSLGPITIDKIIPTRYLFELGEVKDYRNVAIYKPDVIGNTGIESINIIKSIIKDINPTKVIIIDALKANNLNRLVKTIQITNSGISPGSGINNKRGEISKKTIKKEVISIGIPTVVDIKSIIKEESSFIVTPTNIDFVIESLSNLLSEGLNKIFHNKL